MYYGGVGSIYDPSGYPRGVPNPYGARVHAWGEGPLPEEGTRFHGPLYTRAMWDGRWEERPFSGVALGELSAFRTGMAICFGLALGVIGAETGHGIVDNANGSSTARVVGAAVGGLIGGVAGAFGGFVLSES